MLDLVGNSPIWTVEKSELFEESVDRIAVTFPDIREKLGKFVEIKHRNPINSKYGKHDRRLTGDLSGFYHCHLRDDAVLIYSLGNHTLTLVLITPHAEIEGKRLKLTARRLSRVAA